MHNRGVRVGLTKKQRKSQQRIHAEVMATVSVKRVGRTVRTMRLSSGMQLPQLVPQFSAACSDAKRAASSPPAATKCALIAVSVTFRQLHTNLPRAVTASGATAPGDSNKRP